MSLALSQDWLGEKNLASLLVFPIFPVSYFYRAREKADTQETEKMGSV